MTEQEKRAELIADLQAAIRSNSMFGISFWKVWNLTRGFDENIVIVYCPPFSEPKHKCYIRGGNQVSIENPEVLQQFGITIEKLNLELLLTVGKNTYKLSPGGVQESYGQDFQYESVGDVYRLIIEKI